MIDKIIEILSLPEKSIKILNISKKLFHKNAELNKKEREALVSEIESIKHLATLNEYSLNVGKFRNEDYDYTDIAIIYINLKKIERITLISRMLHEAIPNPVLLILNYKEELLFTTAPKRLNKIETNKVIIEEINYSFWVKADCYDVNHRQFLNNLKINTLPYDNFYKFYRELDNRIYLTKAYSIFSKYPITIKNIKECKNILKEIENLKMETEVLSKQQKQELNFGKKMDIHIKLKELEMQIEELKNNLNEVV